MKNLKKFFHRYRFHLLAWALFFITRLLILKFPPLYYSDVSHDYERYANMWWYGLTPYLEHYYEYPPATIPILTLPLWMDLKGFGYYYFNYRLIILLLEIPIFAVILKFINRFKANTSKKISIGYYLLAGLIAKDFWYEGLDLIFIGSFIASLWFLIDTKKIKNQISVWFFFWFSSAIKFMTLPLFPILFASIKTKFKSKLLPIIVGGLLVWGLPLAIFRSSLMVSVVFHLNRAAKYGSFQSFIADTVNQFTHTETRVNLPPDFQLAGPISTSLESIFQPIFYLGILVTALIAFIVITKQKKFNLTTALNYTFIYILIVFLTGKTFSSPFHIWLVPLLAIYPFDKISTKIKYLLLALYPLALDTTGFLSIPAGISFAGISLKILRDSTRFIPLVYLLILFISRAKSTIYTKNS